MVDETWAVVPVAGFGARLRPHTHTRPKPLLQVAGQPIIGHILDQLAPLQIERIVLIVGYMGDRIVDYVRSRDEYSRVEFVEQKQMLGLGHAISLTRQVVGGDPMLIVYGDTIFHADLPTVMRHGGDGALGVQHVDDPGRFGVVVEEAGVVQRLVEKPTDYISDLAIVGVNHIRNSGMLFDCLDHLIQADQRTRGEFQLTDAFQRMVDAGAQLSTFPVDGWFDCGTQEALLATNKTLLSRLAPSAARQDLVVVPPVHIDPTAQVSDAVIGPHVSIGAGARVNRAIISNSIVGEEAIVEEIVLEGSLIGFQAIVTGRAHHINVGDLSQITN
ncbi:MAG: NTP transferase domain-containing protein [Gemmatimonadetes bacterium]|jgi:glucose-1-phosphate thymidylyltransferase|nr:NTP transferase domain-containing protein [Gemmatimonadota bacterium]MBT5056539.1 NTP transferase domain-containing protein [Gemmatimonadota bacterium]MBT5145279.1 NTP transferase domain-containing protein [Gemmatimonadota bacterium]MBT5589660.1 NTP transferase domain-containing protein [Gemmatimonadota bacterium]MBT5965283.1 NTP transferase domain-containing protein [Gemmatimonadota bacterium]